MRGECYHVIAPRQFWCLVMLLIFWRCLVNNNFQFSTLSVKLVVPHCRICILLCSPTWGRPENGEMMHSHQLFSFLTSHLLSGFCTWTFPPFSSEPEVADSCSAFFLTFCCQELTVLPFLREVASEGRKSFPHRLAIGEAEAGTGVREVEVADGAAVVFQMTQEA